MPKLIKTEADYSSALSRIDQLMDATPETPELEELELLVALVEMYEEQHFPMDPPDPIEAIKFRMDQNGLKPSDLIPFIGTKARVSEVLNRKRPLTLGMIRALNKALGIPMDILGQEYGSIPCGNDAIEWSLFPVKEVVKLGFARGRDPKTESEEIMHDLLQLAGEDYCSAQVANFRQGARRSGKDDLLAVQTWLLCAKAKARAVSTSIPYQGIDGNFLHQVATFSALPNGPTAVRDLLLSKGIVMVVVPHFKKTYLDGAAFIVNDATPCIALTIRHDRVDNFWFTLLHELSHIMLEHVRTGFDAILDDLDINSVDGQEKSADNVACEAQIPEKEWQAYLGKGMTSIRKIKDLAFKLGIHSAIIAGRVRRARNDYRILSREVGHGEIKRHFVEMQDA